MFVFFTVISCVFLFKSNSFQNHVYLTSANKICSSVYEGKNNITSYFNLKEINNDLQHQNARLEIELNALKSQLRNIQLKNYGDTAIVPDCIANFNFVVADVINNSITKPFNYITIDKGSEDGIEQEMGVINESGVIGVVDVVGRHTSRVISLLNPNFRLSCKVKGHDFFGSLVWGGSDPQNALLEELPRHTEFQIGDTIVTSGYSLVFPEGIIVGTIEGSERDKNDNFLSLKVKLATDFSRLNQVRAIKNNLKEELDSIQ